VQTAGALVMRWSVGDCVDVLMTSSLMCRQLMLIGWCVDDCVDDCVDVLMTVLMGWC
jgi:hypothetical protein